MTNVSGKIIKAQKFNEIQSATAIVDGASAEAKQIIAKANEDARSIILQAQRKGEEIIKSAEQKAATLSEEKATQLCLHFLLEQDKKAKILFEKIDNEIPKIAESAVLNIIGNINDADLAKGLAKKASEHLRNEWAITLKSNPNRKDDVPALVVKQLCEQGFSAALKHDETIGLEKLIISSPVGFIDITPQKQAQMALGNFTFSNREA